MVPVPVCRFWRFNKLVFWFPHHHDKRSQEWGHHKSHWTPLCPANVSYHCVGPPHPLFPFFHCSFITRLQPSLIFHLFTDINGFLLTLTNLVPSPLPPWPIPSAAAAKNAPGSLASIIRLRNLRSSIHNIIENGAHSLHQFLHHGGRCSRQRQDHWL